jgi:hypothetical protein
MADTYKNKKDSMDSEKESAHEILKHPLHPKNPEGWRTHLEEEDERIRQIKC